MTDITKPVRLISVLYESEAAIIVTALEGRGIPANITGGFTSGFRAEAPGKAEVWVKESDLATAQEVLANIKEEAEDIDWSQVDTGDDSPKTVDEFIDESQGQ